MKKEQSLMNLWDHSKRANTCITRTQKKKKENGTEKYSYNG